MFLKSCLLFARQILEVKRTADTDAITKAYRKLAKKKHPDKGGDPEEFKVLVEAYEVRAGACCVPGIFFYVVLIRPCHAVFREGRGLRQLSRCDLLSCRGAFCSPKECRRVFYCCTHVFGDYLLGISMGYYLQF